jgi:DNA-binding protein, ybaB/ebfC family
MAKFNGYGGGGMGNMQSLMKQAQAMQQKMAEAQEELEESEITATSGSGLVEIIMNGKKEILGIKLDPKAVDPEDVEMLEDLIMAAIGEAYSKADELHEEIMGPLSGMGGLGGLL